MSPTIEHYVHERFVSAKPKALGGAVSAGTKEFSDGEHVWYHVFGEKFPGKVTKVNTRTNLIDYTYTVDYTDEKKGMHFNTGATSTYLTKRY